ncbi:hypothetical protein [Candidatus Cytomitobacter primus]|uniref:Uncharacterized protein n=1 Tax=Candidatus Cytomitobacter primus TaxID=2066024 RepID=A0A5C0UIP9_9PROT|nr:hypothetical protein [Candidatus Cytomitobacter primus]QEK38754.1 hypothetical protein FZC34_02450 [Candidatus Cytomitobacter primus]
MLCSNAMGPSEDFQTPDDQFIIPVRSMGVRNVFIETPSESPDISVSPLVFSDEDDKSQASYKSEQEYQGEIFNLFPINSGTDYEKYIDIEEYQEIEKDSEVSKYDIAQECGALHLLKKEYSEKCSEYLYLLEQGLGMSKKNTEVESLISEFTSGSVQDDLDLDMVCADESSILMSQAELMSCEVQTKFRLPLVRAYNASKKTVKLLGDLDEKDIVIQRELRKESQMQKNQRVSQWIHHIQST